MANDLRTPTLAPRETGGAGANGPIRAHIPQILTPTDYRPEQVRQLNSAIKEHNDQLFGIYLMRVQATAKEKDNELAKASQALLTDPENGYFNKHGKDAVDAYEGTIEELKKLNQGLMDGIDDPLVREAYGKVSQQRMDSLTAQMQDKYAKDVFQWNVNESNSRMVNLAEGMAANYGGWTSKDSPFTKNYLSYKQEAIENLQLRGIDPDSEQGQEFLRESLTKIHSGIIDQYLNNEQPKNALAYLKNFRPEMSAKDIQRYMKSIKDTQRTLNARYLAQQSANGQFFASKKDIDTFWRQESHKYDLEILAVRNDAKLTEQEKLERIGELQEAKSNLAAYCNKEKNNFDIDDRTAKDTAFEAFKTQGTIYLQSLKGGKPTLEDAVSADLLNNLRTSGLEDAARRWLNNGGVEVSNKPLVNELMAMDESRRNLMTFAEWQNLYIHQVSAEDAESLDALYWKSNNWDRDEINNKINAVIKANFPNITKSKDPEGYYDLFRTIKLTAIKTDEINNKERGYSSLSDKIKAIDLAAFNNINIEEDGSKVSPLDNRNPINARIAGDLQGIGGEEININIPEVFLFSPRGINLTQRAFADAMAMGGDETLALAGIQSAYEDIVEREGANQGNSIITYQDIPISWLNSQDGAYASQKALEQAGGKMDEYESLVLNAYLQSL